MPSLSRTYYESQSIEEVFLRRQMQHIAVALDKSPLLHFDAQRRPTTSDGRDARRPEAAVDSLARPRAISPLNGGLSMHTLHAIAHAGSSAAGSPSRGAATRLSPQRLARAPTTSAHGAQPRRSGALASGVTGQHAAWHAERTLEWPAPSDGVGSATTTPLSRRPSGAPAQLPPVPAPASFVSVAEERATRDAATIAELRMVVDALRARLDAMERMMRSVNLEYTLNTQRLLQDSFGAINERLGALDTHLLTERQKAQVRAATLLCAVARGFVARVRYRRARDALGAWRRRALRTSTNLMTAWLLRARRIGERLERIEQSAARTILLTVTTAWRAYTRGNVPARGELAETLRARRHYDWRLAKASLSGWQRVVRRARIAGMRYVFRANKRVALRESEVVHMRLHLVAWRQVTTALLQVERMHAAMLLRMAARTLHALRAWVSRARALRLVALERWIELMKGRSELPFRAWFLHTVDRKIVRRSHEALTKAFRQRLSRGLVSRIVRAWFDLAVHKRVEVRSRSQLIRALHEQEEMTVMLEENISEYSLVLQEAEASLQREEMKQKELIHRQQALESLVVTSRLAVHAAQQESTKLRAALRNYELRFPNAFREPGESREKLAQTPLLVSQEDHDILERLRWAVSSHVYDAAYVPPPAAETPADRELRRLQRFLGYILRGTLPDGKSYEKGDVDEAELRQLIEQGKIEVPDGLVERPLRTRLSTHGDGGEALERARAGGGFWSSNPFAQASAEAGGDTGLLRVNERALKWSDVAQSMGMVVPARTAPNLDGRAAAAGQGREGLQRRIQEAKEWKHTHQPRKVEAGSEAERRARANVYNMDAGVKPSDMPSLTPLEQAVRRASIIRRPLSPQPQAGTAGA